MNGSRRARATLWHRLRLLVLDLETAVAPDGEHRIVSIAAITCRSGSVQDHWQVERVNPGIPIDAVTMSIHHITDDQVAAAPSFAQIAGDLAPLLRRGDDETLALVAHIARFDIPVLRAELSRAGRTLPDLPVLDTAGPLARLVGLAPRDRSLDALLEATAIANAARHTALGDARATAQAVCLLLNRAADQGHDRLTPLLDRLGSARVADLRFARPSGASGAREPQLPAEHLAAHSVVMAPRAGRRQRKTWLEAVATCAELRCEFLADRVAAAALPERDLVPLLTEQLMKLADAGDVAGTATLLGASVPRWAALPPASRGHPQQALRTAALDLHAELAPRLDPLSRCGSQDRCPACRAGEPCPLDTWRLALAEPALGGPLDKRARGFFETSGRDAGTGAYTEMRRAGDGPLADAALRLVHRHWRNVGQQDVAALLAEQAWAAGCRDPEIAEAYALALAAAGRLTDLDAAISVCQAVLAGQNGSTDEAWRSIAITASQLGGRRHRLVFRPSGKVDADGNPIPIRRHHPAVPKRSRPPRFLRLS
jgi:DNA polymerase III epsilon subunit-like protein